MNTLPSPSKVWPGSVVFPNSFTFPQVLAFEDAIRATQEAGEKITLARANYLMLPGVLACVERFNLEGLPDNMTADTFPATPREASAELLAWLIGEVTKIYRGEKEPVPNE